jgi:IMP and pyridine-specific 5'-nucleotidase
MTSRYRVDYHLKSHRRDELIEWIKGLLVYPFILRELANVHSENIVRDRYAAVFKDLEGLIGDHSDASSMPRLMVVKHQDNSTPTQSKLKMLVPTIGMFFTPLPLEKAFLCTDPKRAISQRRYVAPSFNGSGPFNEADPDIRRLLATAQLLALTNTSSPSTRLKLITFDGDVTLYPDGSTLLPSNPVIPFLLDLLSQGVHIGIVTAAGYPDPEGTEYTRRLAGLLDAVSQSDLTLEQKNNLAILGGECNYLFRYNGTADRLEWVDEGVWRLDEMATWQDTDISLLLDIAERELRECAESMRLDVQIVRKPRAVGTIPRFSQLTCA